MPATSNFADTLLAPVLPPPAAPATITHGPLAVAPAVEFGNEAPPPTAETTPVAVATRAVEAVLTVAERFGTSERQAVSLQFAVGDAELAVRVELRADEVHTTFRTDSAELRAALAQEWQAVGAEAGERPFRLAAPVFSANSADSAGLATAGDGAASRHQDADARRAPGEVSASVVSRARGAAAHATSEVGSSAARLGALPTSLHLHTFA